MEEANCKKLVESHLHKFGKLNILVNNASKQLFVSVTLRDVLVLGLIPRYRFCKQFEEIDLENVQSTFRSNILQMFAVTKFALPHLKRGSSIINTTSVTAYRGSPGLGADYMFTRISGA